MTPPNLSARKEMVEMCGIAGWVDFGRDMTSQRETLRNMTETLIPRGPNAQGVWLDRNVGFGHTRTSVIDPAGGAQPMEVEVDGRKRAVITYSGEVFNFPQLREELEARGHRFRTRCDTEVVLHAYIEWGADCVQRLEGMFAFAVWDLEREELLLVRDRLGIKPLFVARVGDGLVFGSEPKALLAHPMVKPVVDGDGLREMFSTAKTPGASVYRDLMHLRPGHTLRMSRRGIVEDQYWKLEARPHEEDLPSTISTVRAMLESIVHDELVSDVPLCIGLSGGLDSSAITAIAAKIRREAGEGPVRTFSTSFTGYDEHFRPDDSRGTPDDPYAAALAEHVGAQRLDIMLDTTRLMDQSSRAAVVRAQDMPTQLGDMDTSLYLMMRETQRHSTVALIGETADEIFGGFKWWHDDEMVRTENFPWVADADRIPATRFGMGQGLFHPRFRERLDMRGYYAKNYARTLAETPHLQDETPQEFRMRELSYMHLTRWLPMLLDRVDRLSMASALETRVPYCNHRLVEYLYNVPWLFKTFDGREKSLLRAAVADLLPDKVTQRPKSPFPVTQDPAYTKLLKHEMSNLLDDPSAPVLPYLDREAAGASVRGTIAADSDWLNRINIETVLAFNGWLRSYDVEVVL